MTLPEQLRDKIGRLSNLPTLHQIATSILQEISNSENSADQLAELLKKDIALTAKILKLANSAYYGVPRMISNIQEAVVLLGTDTIATMVLTVTVFDFFPDEFQSPSFRKEDFWKHSIATAVIAQSICNFLSKSNKINPDDMFVAGLLHDIGKVVMEQYIHNDMLKSVTMFKSTPEIKTIFDAEKKVLGYTHCDIASWLLSKWNFPDRLLNPIIYHHTPFEYEETNEYKHILIVASANELAQEHYTPYDSKKIHTNIERVDELFNKLAITRKKTSELYSYLDDNLEKSVEGIMIFFKN